MLDLHGNSEENRLHYVNDTRMLKGEKGTFCISHIKKTEKRLANHNIDP